MKIKSLWIPFALFLLVAVPLRVYQVAYLIDPATGFFESGESLYQIFLGILALFVLIIMIMTASCKNTSEFQFRRNIFSGVFALAAALACATPAQAQVPPTAAETAAYQGLHAAAARGDVPRLTQLIAARADVNARDGYGRTPLHVATFARQADAIRALAQAGADLNALENDRYDAVTIAAVADDEETLRVLLSLGASAKLITSRYDGTALIAAAHLGHDGVVRQLIAAGAPPDHVNNLHWTALIESIEGKAGRPRYKPPYTASNGLYGAPTNVNNTESYASIPFILKMGAEAYLDMGVVNNGGTKIFSVSWHVNRPGNYEIPLGTPFAELLEMAGGMKDGKKLKAVIPGGSSAPVLPADIMMDCTMDYDSIAKAGSMLGSGAVIVMNEDVCMVKALERLAYFYHEESCGQCTPCREGTGWLYRIIHRIEHGEGRPEDLDLLASVGNNMAGRTICALADAAVFPVRSFTKHFRNEFEYHIEHKKCLVNHKWC